MEVEGGSNARDLETSNLRPTRPTRGSLAHPRQLPGTLTLHLDSR